MIRQIARKELLVNLLSLRFLISTVVTVLLMGIVGFVLVGDYSARHQAYLADIQQHRTELQQTKVYSLVEVVLDIPPSPLSIFSTGVKDMQSSVRVSPYQIPSLIDEGGGSATIGLSSSSTHAYNPLLRIFTSIDLCFVISMILSLFSIILVFDSFSGEREQGTLKLILSNPAGRTWLFLAKYIGALTTIAIPMTLGFLVIMILWSLSPGISLDAPGWIGAILIYLVSLIFLASFLALALLISLFARESSSGLMSLLLIWVLLFIVIPEGGAYLSEYFSPEDVRTNVLNESDQAAREFSKTSEAIEYRQKSGWNNAMTDQYKGEAMLGITEEEVYNRLEYNQKVFPLKFRFAEERYRVVESYATALRSWSRMRNNLIRPSLPVLYRNVVQAIAGTDIETRESVLLHARTYRDALMAYLQPKLGSAAWFTRALEYPDVQPTDENQRRWQELIGKEGERAVEKILSWDRVTPIDLGAMPQPNIDSPGLGERIGTVSTDVLLLLGSAVMFLSLSLFVVQRYSLR
jgi:ABC-type transport system involved in multi-copper enzyme maturation permease subunit